MAENKKTTVVLKVTVPTDYSVTVFQAGSAVAIPWDTLSETGKSKAFLYGVGRYLRDGAQTTYATDDKGKVVETPEGKKAKSLAHAETRLAALISGEIATRSGGTRVPTLIRYLKKNVITFATRTLGMKVKDVPKLGDNLAGIKAVCDTLKGCPYNRLLENAQAQADLEDGIDFSVDATESKRSK
jgi:hypothetical protein